MGWIVVTLRKSALKTLALAAPALPRFCLRDLALSVFFSKANLGVVWIRSAKEELGVESQKKCVVYILPVLHIRAER